MAVQYWLDTNVYITAKNYTYPFDLFPGFWSLLAAKAEEGIIRSPYLVYRELVDKTGDELAGWAKETAGTGLFVEPDAGVQVAVKEIVQHVMDTYPLAYAEEFLGGADPWLIAHCKVQGGSVVTLEKFDARSKREVKIPNVCQQFSVKYMTTIAMLRALGASF